jgi:DNA-directed RNA polymerase subunit RPC12/RpoP
MLKTINDMVREVAEGEGEYVCSDCGKNYLLNEGQVSQDSPNHASFICDICKGREE